MSLYEKLSLIVAVLGFATVVASILFLRKSVQCDTYASVTSNLTITKQIFIEHPKFRKYFYLRAEIAEDNDNEDYQTVLSIAEHLLDFFDGILLLKSPLWPPPLWSNYIRDSFDHSPILCKYLEGNQHWYTKTLFTLMNEGLAQRKKALSETQD